MKEQTTTIFKDGAVTRIKNKRIEMLETDLGMMIQVIGLAKGDGKSAASEIVRGKILATKMHLTHETLRYIIDTYLNYLKSK